MPSPPLPITTPIGPDFIHGAVDLEATADGLLPQRLPAWARAQCPDAQLAMAASQPAGVRLVFDTTASALALHAVATRRAYGQLPQRPDGIYQLLVDGRLAQQGSLRGGKLLQIDMATGAAALHPGASAPLVFGDLPAGSKRVEIWLPHDETTELAALSSDAPLLPVAPHRQRWLHHGSSISQGSNARHPTATWPAVAAASAGVELQNLGFSGSALLDPLTAQVMAGLPAELISIKIGINLVNKDALRAGDFAPAVDRFLDIVREGHPATPLYVVSPLCCPMHESVPGPTLFDNAALAEGRLQFRAAGQASELAQGKLSLELIREQLAAIVARRRAQDPQLHYVDGLALYGPADHERLPLPDGLHPDEAAHCLIGLRFAEQVLAAAPRREGSQ